MVHDEQPSEPDASTAPAQASNVEPVPTDPWESVPGEVARIGEYLKKQRQLRGISQEELCRITRIPPRSLERLESGAFDSLDDGFVRGFVRTVADALGLDPDDTLARMSAEPETTNEYGHSMPGPGLLRIGILIAGLALVLVSVGLVRTALDAFPDPQDGMPIVVRIDPVRALAEEVGVADLTTTEVLVPIPAHESRDGDRLEQYDREDEGDPRKPRGPIMRAGASPETARSFATPAAP